MSMKRKLDAKTIVDSQEFKAALKEIREKWKLTLETYVHVKDDNVNQINKASYDINIDDQNDNNQKKEGEGKKRKQKNNTGDKPKRKNKKSKKE